ncbi:MAG: hypothetical protein JXX14_00625 [Deltaproteobacteria bacterium]|nr:hypothetical protein [Deltaproteobacteria bacterium]
MKLVFPLVVICTLSCYLSGAKVTANENKTVSNQTADPRVSLAPGWYVNGDLFAQYNSMGAFALFEMTYNKPLTEKMNMVWSHLELGYHTGVSPTSSSVGVHGEWMPAAIFRLRLLYDFNIFHGAYGSLVEAENPDVPHDEDDISKPSLGGPGIGHRVMLYPVLQMMYRGLALRNQNELMFFGVHTDSPYWFNWQIESFSKASDFVFTERVNVMYDLLVKYKSRYLFVGPFYSLALQTGANYRRQQVGIDIYAEPFDSVGKKVIPHFMLITGFNLEETYRKHEFVVIVNVGINVDKRRSL